MNYIIILIAILFILFIFNNNIETFKSDITMFPYQSAKSSYTGKKPFELLALSQPILNVPQDYVTASNDNRTLGNNHISPAQKVDYDLISAFSKVTTGHKDPRRLNPFKIAPGFKRVHPTQPEEKYVTNYVINQIHTVIDRKYKALDTQKLKKEISGVGNNLIERYVGTMFLVEDRSINVNDYSINITYIVERNQGKMNIIFMKLLGREPEGSVTPLDKNDKNMYEMVNDLHLQEPFTTTNSNVLFDDLTTRELMRKQKDLWETPDYKCFNSLNPNAINKEECNFSGGVWDTPVKSDYECPYFNANQNYNNKRGGARADGSCEMPLNMKPIGYRNVSKDPEHKPWCYNCKIGSDGLAGGIGQCCEEQKSKYKYPTLKTPDYAFPGDLLERGHAKHELTARGLHWQRHPSNQAERNKYTLNEEVADHEQKNPVFKAFIG